MEELEKGESRATVAERFKIGKMTLHDWQKRREETGDFQSKKPGNIEYNHKMECLHQICKKFINSVRNG